MMFLLGRQAMLGQEPPIYFRSITATCFPCLASVHAMYLDPSPLPKTTMSYSSGLNLSSPLRVKGGVELKSLLRFIKLLLLRGVVLFTPSVLPGPTSASRFSRENQI